MNKLAILIIFLLAGCASARSQTAKLFQERNHIAEQCQSQYDDGVLKTRTARAECESSAVLLKARKIYYSYNYDYIDLLKQSYDSQISLAKRVDSKKISLKEYEHRQRELDNQTNQLLSMKITGEEQEDANLMAGAMIMNQGLTANTYEPNPTINCTSYGVGNTVNTNCY